jgi:hypothetical protein
VRAEVERLSKPPDAQPTRRIAAAREALTHGAVARPCRVDHLRHECSTAVRRGSAKISERRSRESEPEPQIRAHGIQVVLQPLVKLNVDALQNGAALRYQTW